MVTAGGDDKKAQLDRLVADICVTMGFCGGTCRGQSCHVTDLLPRSGVLTAPEFARLAMLADGFPEEDIPHSAFARDLERKFRDHFDADEVNSFDLK